MGEWERVSEGGGALLAMECIRASTPSTRKCRSACWQEGGSWGVINGKAGEVGGGPDR